MVAKHPDKMPCLVFANSKGEIEDFPELSMAGRSAYDFCVPELRDLIPLPEGSEIFVLPNRLPVGIDPCDNAPAKLVENPFDSSEGIRAVAAFISPAHTSIHLAAYEKDDSDPIHLPLFAYTAIGWYDNQFWVSAFRSDPSPRQEIAYFEPDKIQRHTQRTLAKHPDNRLIQHLGKCCLTYGCPAAKNFFLGRQEAPLPTSPVCNARCVGCISLQPSGCCPSTQERLKFVPSVQEIGEVAIPHLEKVRHGVVSFGQGCEGEPLLQAETLSEAIMHIRKHTERGTINLNSNASLPEAIERLAVAGLDSLRASMNSARLREHGLYYRPSGFDLNSVKESIKIMKHFQRFVSLNYFIFAGVTDSADEFDGLCTLIDECRPDFIQLRNLNMDPDWYLETIKHPKQENPTAMGICHWLENLKKRFPFLQFGYFNPSLE